MNKRPNNLKNMMCLDVFLMSLNPQERQALSTEILADLNLGHVLLYFDVISLGFEKLKKKTGIEDLLRQFVRKFGWQAYLSKILRHDFEALILTNNEREILWVDKGFEKMTGYTAKEAIGRKPTFLQGKNTEESSRLLFREKLALEIPFEATITNYRKNGAEYLCKVKIFPLLNKHNQVSYYLALEQEIK